MPLQIFDFDSAALINGRESRQEFVYVFLVGQLDLQFLLEVVELLLALLDRFFELDKLIYCLDQCYTHFRALIICALLLSLASPLI